MRFSPIRLRKGALGAVMLAPVLLATGSYANDSGHIARVPTTLAEPKRKLLREYDSDAKAARNLSGAACFEDGRCLVVADEMVAVQELELQTDGSTPSYRAGTHFGDLFKTICADFRKGKKCDEVDLEGIDLQGGSVLITGSMGNRRGSGKKDKARWFLAQFDIDSDGKPVDGSLRIQSRRKLLRKAFEQHAQIDDYLEKPLQCDGMNIEGLARLGDDIYFGLRSPALREEGVAMLVRSPMSLLDAKKKSEVPDTELIRLVFRDEEGPLKNTGIRALEPLGERLLIATGDTRVSPARGKKSKKRVAEACSLEDGETPNTSNDPDRPRIWIWDPRSDAPPAEIARLAGAYGDQKLEGIAVIGEAGGRVDLLLVIDDPGKDAAALALLPQVSVPAP